MVLRRGFVFVQLKHICIFSIGFNAPFIYIPDRAEKELLLTRKQGAMLLSVVGISNTIGEFLLHYFTLSEANSILMTEITID